MKWAASALFSPFSPSSMAAYNRPSPVHRHMAGYKSWDCPPFSFASSSAPRPSLAARCSHHTLVATILPLCLSAMFCHLALPLALALASSRVAACPEHGFPGPGQLNKRAGGELDWAYDASYNWGMLNESTHFHPPRVSSSSLTACAEYRLCQTGTRQSPIQLFYSHGLSHAHLPSFDEASYAAVPGVMQNWG